MPRVNRGWNSILRLLFLLITLSTAQIARADDAGAKQRTSSIYYNNFSEEELHAAKRAVRKNRKACRRGDAKACVEAGYAYLRGEGVEQVGDIAAILFGEACDADLAAGCAELGKFHQGEGGSPQDYPLAASSFEKACDLGHLDACKDLAVMYRTEWLGSPDPARSDAIAEAACNAGGNEACFYIADTILSQEQWSEDHLRAQEILDRQCREGFLKACNKAVIELNGQAYRDEWQVGEYQHLACYLENVGACLDAGRRAYHGIGVTPDRDRAITYYDHVCTTKGSYCEIAEGLRKTPALRAACGPEDVQACADLGRALTILASPEVDVDAAISYLEFSCLNGATNACGDAAEQMRWRFSTDDADGAAGVVDMFERACAAEDLESCFELADIYEKGSWAVTDTLRAGRLFNELCSAGMEEACAREEQFSGVVPEARIAVADAQFLPPDDADEPTQVPQDDYVIEAPPADFGKCVESRERFRGKVYTQRNCPASAGTINGYRLQRGQAPWQALLWRPKRLAGQTLSEADRVLCGGSLIAKGWILTAAHCLTDNGTNVRTGGHRVRLGVYNPRIAEGISYPIIRTIAHPQYNRRNRYVFDIALIQYNHRAGTRPGRTNKIASIKLDPLKVGKRRIKTGMPAYSYGWGWTEAQNSSSTDYLQGVKMQLRSEGACTRLTKFRGSLRHAALCAGGRNYQQTCFGDSGGPLVFYGDQGRRPTLIGVVSAGKKCGSTGIPSQYTRVAKVKSWIARYVSAVR